MLLPGPGPSHHQLLDDLTAGVVPAIDRAIQTSQQRGLGLIIMEINNVAAPHDHRDTASLALGVAGQATFLRGLRDLRQHNVLMWLMHLLLGRIVLLYS